MTAEAAVFIDAELRCPVRCTTGVWPLIPHVVPARPSGLRRRSFLAAFAGADIAAAEALASEQPPSVSFARRSVRCAWALRRARMRRVPKHTGDLFETLTCRGKTHVKAEWRQSSVRSIAKTKNGAPPAHSRPAKTLVSEQELKFHLLVDSPVLLMVGGERGVPESGPRRRCRNRRPDRFPPPLPLFRRGGFRHRRRRSPPASRPPRSRSHRRRLRPANV
jgi:hypothetical protein